MHKQNKLNTGKPFKGPRCSIYISLKLEHMELIKKVSFIPFQNIFDHQQNFVSWDIVVP